MKLTFLGVGGAFTMKNWQSNMLFQYDEHAIIDGVAQPTKTLRMLLDCGGDIRFSLAERGLGVKDIDAVYISHLHADHCSGLGWLGWNRYFMPGPKPDLYINEKMAGDLWNKCLCGDMESHEGAIFTLDSHFNVHRVKRDNVFTWGDSIFRPIYTIHMADGYGIIPSYGLLISNPGGDEAFITADTKFWNGLNDNYRRAKIIFHDCETYDLTGKIKSGVHAHYNDLKTLNTEIKRKMWLYHYADGELPNALEDGFAGFVQKGQTFDL